MTIITVSDVTRRQVLAQGVQDEDVILLEGAYYFATDQVDMTDLIVTGRIYICPYKGKCHWIDLDSPHGLMRDVAWVYTEPNDRYDYIRDKIGFAFGMRPGVVVERG